jgi:hypothetical protein
VLIGWMCGYHAEKGNALAFEWMNSVNEIPGFHFHSGIMEKFGDWKYFRSKVVLSRVWSGYYRLWQRNACKPPQVVLRRHFVPQGDLSDIVTLHRVMVRESINGFIKTIYIVVQKSFLHEVEGIYRLLPIETG